MRAVRAACAGVPPVAVLALVLVLGLALTPQAAGRSAAPERRCGTDGRAAPRAVDLRARGVGCRTARQLARRWFGAAYQGDARRRIYDGLERRWICGVRAGSGRVVACGYGRSTVTFRLREAPSGAGGAGGTGTPARCSAGRCHAEDG